MPKNLLPRDGSARLYEDVLPQTRGQELLLRLQQEIPWRQEFITIMGKRRPIPRLQAWFGEESYVYSGILHEPAPWPEPVLELKRFAERCADTDFNSVLVNFYRDGRDSVSWHADDEPSLGSEPIIASLSLGVTRKLQFRHKREGLRVDVNLPHRSCLLMAGPVQHHWQHQVSKSRRVHTPRINLTFRRIGKHLAIAGN